MIDRIPPQNTDAEQAVLGAMLIEKEAISKVAEFLKGKDFYREAHKIIYDTMIDIFNKNKNETLSNSCRDFRFFSIIADIS